MIKKLNQILVFLIFLTTYSAFSQESTRSIVPRAHDQGSIGVENKQWADGWFTTLHVGGNEVPTMAWTPASRVINVSTGIVLSSDYLIWMDSEAAGVPQTLTFPDMDIDSMTVVIRHLGNDNPTKLTRIHGTITNTYQIFGDGGSIAVDWLGAKTNWYWRQAY